MSDLAAKQCVPCRGGVPAMTAEQIRPMLSQLDGWEAENHHHLVREFSFADFQSALAFVNRVGAVAEEQAHHPDIFLAWGRVGVKIWTHKIDGLTESDFILAAKIDQLRNS
jgi:4a-hydroxytetrahydrobiopterin dehydratase